MTCLTAGLAERLRRHLRGAVDRIWPVYGNPPPAQGRWCCPHRALDRFSTLANAVLGERCAAWPRSCSAVGAGLMLGQGSDVLAEAARFALEVGPASSLVREASADVHNHAEAEVLAALRRHERNEAVTLGARCWLYRAGQASDAASGGPQAK